MHLKTQSTVDVMKIVSLFTCTLRSYRGLQLYGAMYIDVDYHVINGNTLKKVFTGYLAIVLKFYIVASFLKLVDNQIGWILRRCFNITFSIICTFGSIIYLTPYMAIPILALTGFYFALQVRHLLLFYSILKLRLMQFRFVDL